MSILVVMEQRGGEWNRMSFETLAAADPGGSGPGGHSGAGNTLERIYLPERTKRTQLFEGNPKEAAAKLVEKLRFEARVI